MSKSIHGPIGAPQGFPACDGVHRAFDPVGEILDDPDAMSGLMPEWSELVATERPSNFFVQPAVWQSWRRILGDDASPRIVTARQGGLLIGLMPAMIVRALRGPTLGVRYDYDPADRDLLAKPGRRMLPVRQFSPLLSLSATMLGPLLLSRPGCRPAAVRAVANAIGAVPHWDLAILPVDEEEAEVWIESFRDAGLRSSLHGIDRASYFLSGIAPFVDLVAKQRKKFRQNYRRALAAADRNKVRTTLCEDVPLMLDQLATVAAASWKTIGRSGQDVLVPYEGRQRAFFEHLFTFGSAEFRPLGAVATVNDAPIAIMISAVHGSTLTTLLTFWTGRVKEASPGLLLLGLLIDWAAQNGIELIDFNSNNPWLRHIADRTTVQQNLLVFAPTPRGRLLAMSRAATVGIRTLIAEQRRAGNDDDGIARDD